MLPWLHWNSRNVIVPKAVLIDVNLPEPTNNHRISCKSWGLCHSMSKTWKVNSQRCLWETSHQSIPLTKPEAVLKVTPSVSLENIADMPFSVLVSWGHHSHKRFCRLSSDWVRLGAFNGPTQRRRCLPRCSLLSRLHASQQLRALFLHVLPANEGG